MPSRPPEEIEQGVGLTALQVAAARAIHTDHARRLVEDTFAAEFVRAASSLRAMPSSQHEARSRFAHEPIWLDSSTYVGVRTRFFDDYLAAASAAGIRQVVILAAGLDARAFRLDWPPDSTIYEIDHASVLVFKDAVLARRRATSRCDRRVVRVDLRDDWEGGLIAAGFVPEQPTAWVAEGLLPYLPADAQQRLVAAVDHLSATGSWCAIEDTNSLADMRDNPELAEAARTTDIDVRPFLHGDDRAPVADVLGGMGWTVTVRPATAAAQDYGQEIGPLVRRLSALNEFVTAEHRHPTST